MVQRPQLAFRDPKLQQCRIERDAMNQPRVWSGAFAVVYKAVDPASGQPTAVRAFTSASPERRERYAHICAYVASRRVKCLVGVEYRDEAIRSARDGKWYPLVLMDWVEGRTLFEWVREKCLAGDAAALRHIGQQWLGVVQELGEKRIAHGDISHSNVLVTASGELKLVDYDGMCVPALVGRKNLEIGMRPYQHPQRDAETRLSLSLDHYSSLVIYTALRALAADPTLWSRHMEGSNNEKLLFSDTDFSDFGKSALFRDLARSCDAKVRELAGELKRCSAGKIDDVPPLVPIVLRPIQVAPRSAPPSQPDRSVLVRRRLWPAVLAGCALASGLAAAAYCLWSRSGTRPVPMPVATASLPAPTELPARPPSAADPTATVSVGRSAEIPSDGHSQKEVPHVPASLEPPEPAKVPKPAAPPQPPAPVKPTEPPASPKPPPLATAPFSPNDARAHQARWAAYLNVPVEITNLIGMKMVLIPPGEFMMGSPDTDPDAQVGEFPQHRVRITQPFYLGAYEVTVGQFKRFVKETGYQTDEEKGKRRTTWRIAVAGQSDDHPVVVVSWNDAVAFAAWLSRKENHVYRLPTEAEWEYACRAGTTTRWSFGDKAAELKHYAWYDANTNRRRPYPIGQKKPNPWGLFDMHGNVEEWCADWDALDYYATSPLTDPPGPETGTQRVARGGSFYFGAVDARSAWRDRSAPDNCGFNTGFRLARTLSF